MRREDTITVDIATVSAEQAPVVMRVPESPWTTGPRVAELRGFDGHLFEPLTDEHVHDGYPLKAPSVPAGSHLFPLEWRSNDGSAFQGAAQAQVRRELGRHLVVDGLVWIETDEPV